VTLPLPAGVGTPEALDRRIPASSRPPTTAAPDAPLGQDVTDSCHVTTLGAAAAERPALRPR